MKREAHVIRGDTSQGVHVRALWEVLTDLIDLVDPDVGSEKRVRLRNCRAALERAYPHILANEVALMQQIAEEDGLPQED